MLAMSCCMLVKPGVVVHPLDEVVEEEDEDDEVVEEGRPMYAPRLMLSVVCFVMSDGGGCVTEAGSKLVDEANGTTRGF
jgi:hypothetical protein